MAVPQSYKNRMPADRAWSRSRRYRSHWSSRTNFDTSVDEMRAPLFIQSDGVLILESDEDIVRDHHLRHARVSQVRVHGIDRAGLVGSWEGYPYYAGPHPQTALAP
jgi:hypothetical protein